MKDTEERKLSELTDHELLQESKKLKLAAVVNAFLIGFFAGILVYSIAKNSLGFLTLIPLFFVYKLINRSDYRAKEVKTLLEERKLK